MSAVGDSEHNAIERRYPTDEVRALVSEIRCLNVIAKCANDLVRTLEM